MRSPNLKKLSDHTRLARRWRSLLVASVVFLVSLLATSCVSQQVFEGVPHIEDEVAFLFQAKTLAAGRIWVDTPANLEFFNLPFLIDHDGKWFGKYPPGHPLVLALGVLAGQPWLVDPLASSLALAFVYLLGRKLYGERTALIAAGLGIVSPFFLLQSGTYLSHPTTLLFLCIFLYSLVRMDEGSRPFAALAGVSLGMAFLSRQLTAVGMATPFVLYGLWRVARQPRQQGMNYLLIAMGCVPFLATLLVYNAALTGNPFASTYELYWPYDRIGFGPGIGLADQHTLASGLLNTRTNLESLTGHLFGWPWHLDLVFVAISLVALALNLGRCAVEASQGESLHSASAHRRALLWDGLLFATACSLIAVHILYWTSGLMYGPRYYFEAIPAFLLLSARGISHTATLAGAHQRLHHPRVRRLLNGSAKDTASVMERLAPSTTPLAAVAVGAVVAALVAHSLTTYLPAQFSLYRGWYGITAQAPRLASQLSLRRALVFVPPGESWTDYAPLIGLNSPTLDSEVVFALDHGPERNQVVIEQLPGRCVYYWNDIAGYTPSATGD